MNKEYAGHMTQTHSLQDNTSLLHSGPLLLASMVDAGVHIVVVHFQLTLHMLFPFFVFLPFLPGAFFSAALHLAFAFAFGALFAFAFGALFAFAFGALFAFAFGALFAFAFGALFAFGVLFAFALHFGFPPLSSSLPTDLQATSKQTIIIPANVSTQRTHG